MRLLLLTLLAALLGCGDDDTAPDTGPGDAGECVPEVCDFMDNDCDGNTDEISSCECGELFAECDGDPAQFCETNIGGDSANCGECGMACPSGQICSEAECVPGVGTTLLSSGGARVAPDGMGGVIAISTRTAGSGTRRMIRLDGSLSEDWSLEVSGDDVQLQLADVCLASDGYAWVLGHHEGMLSLGDIEQTFASRKAWALRITLSGDTTDLRRVGTGSFRETASTASCVGNRLASRITGGSLGGLRVSLTDPEAPDPLFVEDLSSLSLFATSDSVWLSVRGGGTGEELVQLDETGAIVRRESVSVAGHLILSDGNFYVLDTTQSVTALAPDLSELWSIPISTSNLLFRDMVLAGDTLYLIARIPADGGRFGDVDFWPEDTGTDTLLAAIDTTDGTVTLVRRIGGASDDEPWQVAADDTRLFVVGEYDEDFSPAGLSDAQGGLPDNYLLAFDLDSL